MCLLPTHNHDLSSAMSSLLKRVRDAEKSVQGAADNVQLLPFSLMEGYLKTNPLVLASGMDPRDVHSSLVRLHTFFRSSGFADEAVEESVPLARRCEFCDEGFHELNAKEGIVSCSNCGACMMERLNIVPEYVSRERDKNKKRPSDKVPMWMMELMRSKVDTDHTSYWNELQEWNAYCNLSTDELMGADRLLQMWRANGGDTRDSRMIASLLYMRIKDRIPSSEEVRDGLRKKQLRDVDCAPPKPSFGCSSCEEKHHSMKAARWCCKLFKNKEVKLRFHHGSQ